MTTKLSREEIENHAVALLWELGLKSSPDLVDKATEHLEKLAEKAEEKIAVDCRRLIYLFDIEEDSEMTGKLFHPNTIRSCRVLDGQEIVQILERFRAL